MDLLLLFLTTDFMGKPAWVWLSFLGIVVALPALNWGLLHKGDRAVGVRESLLRSAGHISVALIFRFFGILGLRALYFALAAMIRRFRYLKYALALVLVFIASQVPAVVLLSVTFGLIAGGVLVSLWKTRGQSPAGLPA